jgi:hypothetical protein
MLSRLICGGFTAVLLSNTPAWSQVVSFGVKAGVPLTTAYSTTQDGYASATAYDRSYIIGPTAEVHLPFHLSFEVDALYRRSGFDVAGSFPNATLTGYTSFDDRSRVNDWQFPVLAKYELKFGPLRPFADGGFVYRRVTGGSPDNGTTIGAAVGGGVTIKLLFLRLSPEIRYTHWPTRPFVNGYNGLVTSTANQADLLLGVSF